MDSTGDLYGKGVFTTIAIVDGEPFLWEKHWRRLTDTAKKIALDLDGVAEASLLSELKAEIDRESLASGAARITIRDRHKSELWSKSSDGANSPEVSILTRPPRPRPAAFAVAISAFSINSRSPIAGLKTCNYLENILAIEAAKADGFDEALRTNENGIVTGGVMSNVFWRRGARVYTPSLASGCLPGTTREYITDQLDCEEVERTLDEVLGADSVVFTSAGIGAVPAAMIDGRSFDAEAGEILTILPF